MSKLRINIKFRDFIRGRDKLWLSLKKKSLSITGIVKSQTGSIAGIAFAPITHASG